MTTRNKWGLIALLMGSTLIGACKKDSNGGGSSSSKVSLLTSGTWTFQSYNDKNSAGQWVNDDPSAVHFQVTFNADGTVTETGLSTIGHWQANSDFTTLTVNGTDAYGSFSIVTLTSASLDLLNLNPASNELWKYTK